MPEDKPRDLSGLNGDQGDDKPDVDFSGGLSQPGDIDSGHRTVDLSILRKPTEPAETLTEPPAPPQTDQVFHYQEAGEQNIKSAEEIELGGTYLVENPDGEMERWKIVEYDKEKNFVVDVEYLLEEKKHLSGRYTISREYVEYSIEDGYVNINREDSGVEAPKVESKKSEKQMYKPGESVKVLTDDGKKEWWIVHHIDENGEIILINSNSEGQIGLEGLKFRTVTQEELNEWNKDNIINEIDQFLSDRMDSENEKIRKQGFLGKFWKKIKRNHIARIATGAVTVFVGSAIPGYKEASHLARIALGALGGGIAGEGMALGKTESSALKKLENCRGEKDAFDLDRVRQLFDSMSEEEVIETIALLTEASSAKGMEINVALAKKEKEIYRDKLGNANKYSKMIDKLRDRMATLPLYKQIGLYGLIAIGVGSALPHIGVTGIVAGGINASLQFALGTIRTRGQQNGEAYEYSDIVVEARHALARKLADLSEEELKDKYKQIEERKSEIQQGRKKYIIGGAFIGTAVAEASFVASRWMRGFFGGHHVEGNQAENTQSNDVSPLDSKSTDVPINSGSETTPIDYHGADNLAEEIKNAGGMEKTMEILSKDNAAYTFAKHIEEGLSQKGLLPDIKPGSGEKFVNALVEVWHREGYIGANGAFTENGFNNFETINPIVDANNAAGLIDGGAVIPVYDAFDTVSESKIPEPNQNLNAPEHPSPTSPPDTSGNNNVTPDQNAPAGEIPPHPPLPEENVVDRLFPEADKTSFDSGKPLTLQQIKDMFNPDKHFVSPEVGEALTKMLHENTVGTNNIKIDPTGNKLMLNLGDRYHVHDLLNHFQPQPEKNPWWNPLGLFTSKTASELLPVPEPPTPEPPMVPLAGDNPTIPGDNITNNEQNITVELPAKK